MDFDPNRVYTLADLEHWNFSGTALAVLGHPVAHSLSPRMHNAALAEMEKTAKALRDWRYFKFDIDPDDLHAALKQFHDCGFEGFNLTVPHKVQAVELVEGFKPGAAAMGAVNTLIRSDNGYVGANTDGHGLKQAVLEDLGEDMADRTIMIAGAGGAARAIAVYILREVIDCSILIVNRSAERLKALVETITMAVPDEASRVSPIPLAEVSAEACSQTDLLINATSLGLKPEDPAPVDLSVFRDDLKVYDTTYGKHKSQLITTAKERGMRCANGLSMLLHQGARALEMWTGRDVPVDVMRKAIMDTHRYSG